MSMHPQGGLNTLEYGYAETGEQSKVVSRFFQSVYLWMAIGLVWTAIVSWAFANVTPLRAMMSPGFLMAAGLIAFVVAIAAQSIALRVNVVVGLGLFLLYASLVGLTIAPIWVVYKQATIGAAFALTGGTFFAMSVIGFITKIDLSKIQSILIMCVWGLVIASVINYFMASSMMSWIITYAIVIIFPILVASKTQELKAFALENGHDNVLAPRVAVVGSLVLYIAFINIFLSLLRILGDRD